MSVPKSFLDRVLDLYRGKRNAYVFKFLYGKSSISVIYFFLIWECGMQFAESKLKKHEFKIEYSGFRNPQSEI